MIFQGKRREEKRREEKRREEKRREEKRREEKRRELYMSCQREKQHNLMRMSFFFYFIQASRQ